MTLRQTLPRKAGAGRLPRPAVPSPGRITAQADSTATIRPRATPLAIARGPRR